MVQVLSFWKLVGALCCALALLTMSALASSSEAVKDVAYIALKPTLVVNFGEPTKARIKYIKADISLKVLASKDAQAVEHHMPLIRDTLVSLLAEQQEAVMLTAAGKEQLRQQALVAINQRLIPEYGQGAVAEVYFNNLIIQ